MKATTYQITVVPRNNRPRHEDCEIFTDYQKAVNHLKLICRDLNIPTPENIDTPPAGDGGQWLEIVCGGLGYDYRVYLETI